MNLGFPEYVAMSSVFGLAVSMFLLGSIKIRLTEQLGINDAQMGKVFSVYNFSNLICVLAAGIVCDMLGFKTVAIIGFAAGAAAIFLVGQSKSYSMLIVACLCLGVGSMFMNTAGNTLLGNSEILYADAGRSANMGNVFFGLGAFFIPFITALFFKKGMSLATSLTIIAVIILLPLGFVFGATFPAASGNFSASAATALLTNPTIILCALALMCYIALEVSMAGWITTYMTNCGATEAKASSVLSFFSIAILIGRLVTALVIGKYIVLGDTGYWFIAGAAILAAIILFIAKSNSSEGKGTVLMILVGLMFAPCFPTIAGIMFARVEGAVAGTGFSIIFAIGLLGAIFLPAWMGSISSGEGKSIRDSMLVASGTAVVLFIICVIMAFALPAVAA
jgi:fucose permease